MESLRRPGRFGAEHARSVASSATSGIERKEAAVFVARGRRRTNNDQGKESRAPTSILPKLKQAARTINSCLSLGGY
jgi:hypothetical protein